MNMPGLKRRDANSPDQAQKKLKSPNIGDVCLVSCVSAKLQISDSAQNLYTSPLFSGAKHFATTRFRQWYILSAKYGLLKPARKIDPYEKTLKSLPKRDRKKWAIKVLRNLREVLHRGDVIAIVAGNDYREFLVPVLLKNGIRVRVPLERLSIGLQLQWFKKLKQEQERLAHLDRFYDLLADLGRGLDGKREMGQCSGKMDWPQMGVYFFFEPGEFRTSAPAVDRVVRVGTHTVSKGSRTTLWQRLRTHRGGSDLSGNHRGSIFRLHVGAAMLNAAKESSETWGIGQSASESIRSAEAMLERKVSGHIGKMTLLWIAVEDEPSSSSDRSYIERNAIGLLSGPTGPIDIPSPNWLGLASPRASIRESGLWNLNYIGDDYDPNFLDLLQFYVDVTIGRRPSPKTSLAPAGWFERPKDNSAQLQFRLER